MLRLALQILSLLQKICKQMP